LLGAHRVSLSLSFGAESVHEDGMCFGPDGGDEGFRVRLVESAFTIAVFLVVSLFEILE